MNNHEQTMLEFDNLHARYSQYYRNGEGARSLALTIIYLMPDKRLTLNTYLDAKVHSRAEQKRDRTTGVEVCAFSNQYPDGVYGGLKTHAELRNRLAELLKQSANTGGDE